MESHISIGKRTPAIDGIPKITGQIKFCDDIFLPHMLHAKVKRSSHPHAKILRIKVEDALSLPGVKAVITATDMRRANYFAAIEDEPPLAVDRVRYIGEPIAAVAAESLDVAEEALDAISVEYEPLPAVFNPEEAYRPDAKVVIHPDHSSYKRLFPDVKMDTPHSNISNYVKFRVGNVEKGFKESDIILQNRYSTAMMQHAPIEPHTALAIPEADGSLTLYTANQTPHRAVAQLSQALGMPASKIRVIVPAVGGGYGGKTFIRTETISARLALKTRRPVKFTFTREEVFTSSPNRHAFIIDIKDGASKEGQLIAREVKIILDGGAYSETGYLVTRNAALATVATYKTPNLKVDSYRVYTNKPLGSAFRGFGAPEVQFAVESQMDLIAEKLGMDPVQLRLLNILEEGEVNSLGETVHSIGAKECLKQAAEAIDWGKPLPLNEGKWRRGRGVALGNKTSLAPTAASCIVKVQPDETIVVQTGAVELGQGSNTVMAQIAAEEFKVTLEKIHVISGDTALCPIDHGAISSRQTFNSGNAVRLACQNVKREIFRKAAQRLDAREQDLNVEDGLVYVKGDPSRNIRISDLYLPLAFTGHYLEEGPEFLGKATWITTGVPMNPATGQTTKASAFYAYNAQAFEVEVNIETGQVRVVKAVTATDVGKAVNPSGVEAQLEGGIAMGIGSTLMEEVQLSEGKVLNANFVDYKLPTSQDLPGPTSTRIIIVEEPHREGPYGAKGMGEVVLVSSAPAIATAIFNATGFRAKHIPITAEGVARGLGLIRD